MNVKAIARSLHVPLEQGVPVVKPKRSRSLSREGPLSRKINETARCASADPRAAAATRSLSRNSDRTLKKTMWPCFFAPGPEVPRVDPAVAMQEARQRSTIARGKCQRTDGTKGHVLVCNVCKIWFDSYCCGSWDPNKCRVCFADGEGEPTPTSGSIVWT